MTSYQLQLTGKQTIAEGTLAFYFAKPEGFTFKVGRTRLRRSGHASPSPQRR